MGVHTLLSLLAAASLTISSPLFGQTPLPCGQSVPGALSQAGEQDFYSFAGAAGDAITVRLVRTTGTWSPRLELYGPSNVQIRSEWSYGSPVTLDATLAQPGPHTLVVSDRGGPGTGSYTISWQRLNNPAGGATPNTGQQVFASLTPSVSVAFYSFSAAAGDAVTARLIRASGTWSPRLELYGPTGSRLASDWSYGSPVALDATLAQAGPHTLVVSDREGPGTGNYSVYWQRLNGPSNIPVLNSAQQAFASLGTPGQVGLYTFMGAAGDAVTARLVRTTGTWSPNFELYGPSAVKVSSGWSYGSPISLNARLSQTGPHTLIVSDRGGPGTGGYSVLWVRLNDPASAQVINCGQQVFASLSPPGRIGVYTFRSGAGDSLTARLVRSSGSWSPSLELYGPSEVPLASQWSYGTPLSLDAKSTQTGAHTLVVSDRAGPGTGDYGLIWQALNRPCEQSPSGIAGVVNAASFGPAGAPIAPGSIVSVFGSGFDPNVSLLAKADFVTGSSPPVLPAIVAGISVKFRGLPAALFFVGVGNASGLAPGAFQINCQVPMEAAAGALPVEVFYSNSLIASGTANVGTAGPGIFTLTQSGQGQAVAVNQDGSLNGDPAKPVIPGTDPRPVERGSVIVIYGTGPGSEFKDFKTGQPLSLGTGQAAACAGEPLYATAQNPLVTVGAVPAEVSFSGMAPCFVGLWQINVRVPEDAPVGTAVPLSVSVGARMGNATTIAVR